MDVQGEQVCISALHLACSRLRPFSNTVINDLVTFTNTQKTSLRVSGTGLRFLMVLDSPKARTAASGTNAAATSPTMSTGSIPSSNFADTELLQEVHATISPYGTLISNYSVSRNSLTFM